MALETPASQPAEQNPQAPQAPPPPKPPERRPISTASTRLDPTQPNGIPAEQPAQARGPDGKFLAPATPPVAPPAKPVRPEWLDQVALGLGFTQQEIENADADSLGRAVSLSQRRSAVAAQKPPEVAPPPEPKIDLGLTAEQEEEFGPEMMGVLKKIALDNAKAKQELESRLARYEQNEQARTRSQLETTLDNAFSTLGKEYATVMGDGDGAHIIRNDPASHRRRMFVLTTLQNKGLNFMTASAKAIQDAIKAQVEEDFPGMVQKPAAPAKPGSRELTEPAIARELWDRGGSPPPTQRRGSAEPPPRQGGDIEDRHRGAITEEEIADEKIFASLRNRKRGLPV